MRCRPEPGAEATPLIHISVGCLRWVSNRLPWMGRCTLRRDVPPFVDSQNARLRTGTSLRDGIAIVDDGGYGNVEEKPPEPQRCPWHNRSVETAQSSTDALSGCINGGPSLRRAGRHDPPRRYEDTERCIRGCAEAPGYSNSAHSGGSRRGQAWLLFACRWNHQFLPRPY